MVAIKNVPNKKELQIQHRDGDKKVNVSKRYGSIPLSEVMDYMKAQQKKTEKKSIVSVNYLLFIVKTFLCVYYNLGTDRFSQVYENPSIFWIPFSLNSRFSG